VTRPRDLPDAPRYGQASLAELFPAAWSAVAGAGSPVLPLGSDVRAVVVLIVDGMGRRNLDAHADAAPVLAAAPGPTLDAPFPSTTAVSLTTIGTGRPPGEHGLTGYSLAVAGDDRPLITLTWTWDLQVGGDDARADVPPERLQPHPTVFEGARAAGLRAVTVLRPEFTSSGLTRAGLRGGEVVTATDLEATVAADPSAVASAAAGSGSTPVIVYAHHPDLDAIGHWTGPGSDRWCTELARIDRIVAATREQLPADTVLVVTADHGMVHVPEDGVVELADAPDLLAGVRVLTGDGRARQLHAHPGATDDVLAAWRAQVGDDGYVVTRDQAIAAGWFGPTVTAAARATIGDVVAVAEAPVAWVHRDADLFGGRLPGLHAGLTRTELEVPALVLRA
jgi:hypothetical protein